VSNTVYSLHCQYVSCFDAIWAETSSRASNNCCFTTFTAWLCIETQRNAFTHLITISWWCIFKSWVVNLTVVSKFNTDSINWLFWSKSLGDKSILCINATIYYVVNSVVSWTSSWCHCFMSAAEVEQEMNDVNIPLCHDTGTWSTIQ